MWFMRQSSGFDHPRIERNLSNKREFGRIGEQVQVCRGNHIGERRQACGQTLVDPHIANGAEF